MSLQLTKGVLRVPMPSVLANTLSVYSISALDRSLFSSSIIWSGFNTYTMYAHVVHVRIGFPCLAFLPSQTPSHSE